MMRLRPSAVQNMRRLSQCETRLLAKLWLRVAESAKPLKNLGPEY